MVTARIAYNADFFQSHVPRTKRYPVYIKNHFFTLQGASGKGPAGHAGPLQPGDLSQPVLRQLAAGLGHAGRPRVAVVPAQPQGD